MWIAPSRHPEIKNWEDTDWKALTFASEHDWDMAIEIFEDRIRYRYLDAVQVLQDDDNEYHRIHKQRRFGFAMMALDCLLIETLAQFYDGLKDSDEARKPPLELDNTQFYIRFLTQRAFVLKTFFDWPSANAFYKTIRCGILHQAETKEDSIIRFHDCQTVPFVRVGDSLTIYWINLHKLVRREFETYCVHLKFNDVPGLRDNFRRKMDHICRMQNGILAFGSLLANAGNDLRNITVLDEREVLTPFAVEYARRSLCRAKAPTLVAVPSDVGEPVKGKILVLNADTEVQRAKDALFRRELHKEKDTTVVYVDSMQRSKNDALVIETLVHFYGLGEVYYASLKPNFSEILDPDLTQAEKADLLAQAAIDSVTEKTFKTGMDGIRYLENAIRNGIQTPLTDPYRDAILRFADNAPDLKTARLWAARHQSLLEE